MSRLVVVALLGITGSARAQPIQLRAAAERDRSDGPPAPWSLSDPLWRPGLEPRDAQRDASSLPLKLGAHTWAVVEGSWWSVERDSASYAGLRDRPGHGWNTGLHIAHDFGMFRVDAGGTVGEVDGLDDLGHRNAHGAYTDLGVTISRAFRLSRWNTAWISLGVGHRRWQGAPPPGEADATQVMLTVGVTFR
jgi:hypothetical protein